MANNLKQIKKVDIDSLAFGGSGVGRIDGKVCFVPYSCPGDQLSVEIVSEKQSYQDGRISEISVPSPHRIQPECPLFGNCGGCAWQHIPYALQLRAKQKILTDALWRGAKVEESVVQPIVPSTERYGYRSRVQLKVHGTADGLKIGFFRPNSHYVEDIYDGCPLAVKPINKALASLRDVFSGYDEVGSITEIHLDCAENGVVAIIEYNGKKQEQLCRFVIQNIKRLTPLTALYLSLPKKREYLRLYGNEYLFYSLTFAGFDDNICRLSYLPGSFSQVNRSQNQALLDTVVTLMNPDTGMRLLDLYCGNGNLSLPLCRLIESVTGVEASTSSIAAARYNCKDNAIENATYISADAVGFVKKLIQSGEKYDVVMLDPPRGGAADCVPGICSLDPIKILYISCDPNTLARDCRLFMSNGYALAKSVPLDMFPQTWHLESVTLLVKKGF